MNITTHILLIVLLSAVLIYNILLSRFTITPRIRTYFDFVFSLFFLLYVVLFFWQQKSQYGLSIAVFAAVVVFIATIIAVVGQKRGWIKPSKTFHTNPPNRAFIFAMLAVILSQIAILITNIK